MKMSRQHFEFIALQMSAVRTGITRYGSGNFLNQFDFNFIPGLADDLAATNPNFDKAKFIKACGVEE
jgi:hypothetical protein